MNIIKLKGGLGNQIFQYAFALAYILKGIELRFDLSYYNIDSKHGGFLLGEAFSSLPIIYAQKRDVFYFIGKARNKDGYYLRPNRCIVEEEPIDQFTYDSELQQMEHTYFNGYWQHLNYFNEYGSVLKRQLKFRSLDKEDLKNRMNEQSIISTQSVSLHIRRGDYLQTSLYCNLDLDYYKEAIRHVQSKLSEPHFFIFSDDMEWATDHFRGPNMSFVKGNSGKYSYIDMYLMSLCKHNIIANSTFSWWAAWLNKHSDKIVISPKKWLRKKKDLNGLQPKNWMLI